MVWEVTWFDLGYMKIEELHLLPCNTKHLHSTQLTTKVCWTPVPQPLPNVLRFLRLAQPPFQSFSTSCGQSSARSYWWIWKPNSFTAPITVRKDCYLISCQSRTARCQRSASILVLPYPIISSNLSFAANIRRHLVVDIQHLPPPSITSSLNKTAQGFLHMECWESQGRVCRIPLCPGLRWGAACRTNMVTFITPGSVQGQVVRSFEQPELVEW